MVCDVTWNDVELGIKTFVIEFEHKPCYRHSKGKKEKYRGMFEIQKSGDKTSSGEIGHRL